MMGKDVWFMFPPAGGAVELFPSASEGGSLLSSPRDSIRNERGGSELLTAVESLKLSLSRFNPPRTYL